MNSHDLLEPRGAALGEDAEKPDRRQASIGNRLLMSRLGHYIFGALFVFAFLIFVARSINPTDEQLRGDAMALLLGPFDGVWLGEEVVYSTAGERLGTYESRREYWSSSADIQTAHTTRKTAGKPEEVDSWVNRILEDGSLTSRATASVNANDSFAGRFEAGKVFWIRTTAQGLETRQAWLIGTTLHTQEIDIPSDGSGGTVAMGTYHRVGLGQTVQ